MFSVTLMSAVYMYTQGSMSGWSVPYKQKILNSSLELL